MCWSQPTGSGGGRDGGVLAGARVAEASPTRAVAVCGESEAGPRGAGVAAARKVRIARGRHDEAAAVGVEGGPRGVGHERRAGPARRWRRDRDSPPRAGGGRKPHGVCPATPGRLGSDKRGSVNCGSPPRRARQWSAMTGGGELPLAGQPRRASRSRGEFRRARSLAGWARPGGPPRFELERAQRAPPPPARAEIDLDSPRTGRPSRIHHRLD